MTVATTIGIGATQVGIVTLDSLGVVDPKTSFQPYSTAYTGSDGIKKGQGYAKATWHWDFIHASERAILRAYITGLGGAIHIRMQDNEGSWHEYLVNMAWPEGEENQYATRTMDLLIDFTHLVQEA